MGGYTFTTYEGLVIGSFTVGKAMPKGIHIKTGSIDRIFRRGGTQDGWSEGWGGGGGGAKA